MNLLSLVDRGELSLTQEIAKGNFKIKVRAKGHDEITQLTRSFGQMAEGLAERDKLTRAIEALQGPAKRRGRPPKKPAAMETVAAPKKRKGFSAATKRKMAAAQKKRWAAIKAKK